MERGIPRSRHPQEKLLARPRLVALVPGLCLFLCPTRIAGTRPGRFVSGLRCACSCGSALVRQQEGLNADQQG